MNTGITERTVHAWLQTESDSLAIFPSSLEKKENTDFLPAQFVSWTDLTVARLIDKNKRWTTEFIWFKVEARVREITRWEFSAQHRRWFSVWICISLLSQMKSTTFPVIVENLQEDPLFPCWAWWRILITGNILNGNKQQRTLSKKERKNRRNIQRKKKGTMGGMKEERKGGWKVWEIWEKRVKGKIKSQEKKENNLIKLKWRRFGGKGKDEK